MEITQKAFIRSILNRVGVNSPTGIPVTHGVELGSRDANEPKGDWSYREVVDSFMRLSTITRSDILNDVRAVPRHSNNPTDRHWEAVKEIMAYLRRTRGLGPTFVRGSRSDLPVYSDADYTDKSSEKRSVSGMVGTLGGVVISWEEESITQR